MARQYWPVALPPFHTADGAAYASSTTLTDVSPTPHIAVPAFPIEPGMELEVSAFGAFSTTGTPTLLLGLYWGAVAGVALAASSAITTGSGAASWPFILRYRGVFRTIGASGSIVGQGELLLGTSLTAFTVRPIPETLAARTVTVSTAAATNVTVGAQWGTSSASNTLTCNDISVRVLN